MLRTKDFVNDVDKIGIVSHVKNQRFVITVQSFIFFFCRCFFCDYAVQGLRNFRQFVVVSVRNSLNGNIVQQAIVKFKYPPVVKQGILGRVFVLETVRAYFDADAAPFAL